MFNLPALSAWFFPQVPGVAGAERAQGIVRAVEAGLVLPAGDVVGQDGHPAASMYSKYITL